MGKRNFIENKRAAFLLKLKLKKLNEVSILKNALFQDIFSNQIWERYSYDKIEHLRISGTGYRIYPHPSTAELIQIAVKSEIEEEIIGASRLLYSLEFKGVEFRDELVTELENNYQTISLHKFNLIFEHADLSNTSNLREVLNKKASTVSKDYNYYLNLYERAQNVRAKINPNTTNG